MTYDIVIGRNKESCEDYAIKTGLLEMSQKPFSYSKLIYVSLYEGLEGLDFSECRLHFVDNMPEMVKHARAMAISRGYLLEAVTVHAPRIID